MKDMVELATNKLLNEVTEQAIREALILQRRANEERAAQKKLEDSGEPYNYTRVAILEDGAEACCQVIWKVFGELPIYIISAIRKIAEENNSPYIGRDSQDYIDIFAAAFEEVSAR